MTGLLFLEQALNGLQQGVMLFLLAAGLTLVFGIMNTINLAHGSLYMVGAFVTAGVTQASGSFLMGVVVAVVAVGLLGAVLEVLVLRRLYRRDHLDQVLATFGGILFFNEAVKMIWGPQAQFLQPPEMLSGTVELADGLGYPVYRLVILGVGLAVALAMWLLIGRTRLGMRIRAGATNPETIQALGVDVTTLFTVVFALGAMLAALAGAMAGPILAIGVGMGESILILTFVVIIIGGLGSVKGAFVGALLVGLVDTFGRAFLPGLMTLVLEPSSAAAVGGSLASIGIYMLMAGVLIVKPRGLFPA